MIYLDANATTPCAPEVLDAMMPFFCERFGNASSKHPLGQEAHDAVAKARLEVANLVGARPQEIVFTSGATESIHTAILGALALFPDKNRVISSQVEHPATLMLLETLSQKGLKTTLLPVDRNGWLDHAALEEALRRHEDTAIVSLLWANNETGVLFPMEDIAEVCARLKVPLHVDATQALGRIACDLKAMPIDLLSFSAHKMHGPKGMGALVVKKGLDLPPLLHGHQERRRRGGTENVPGIAGFGAASRLAGEKLSMMPKVARLRDALEKGVLGLFAKSFVNGMGAMRIANTTSIAFPGTDAEELLFFLAKKGILASQGAACAAGENAPSHVLLAMGLTPQEARSSVRFSLSWQTREEDLEAALSALADFIRMGEPA